MKPIPLLFFVAFVCTSGISQSKGWQANPFEHKVFIENKGQFDEKAAGKSSSTLFGASMEGMQYFFSAHGLTYRHDDFIQVEESEKERGGDKEEEKRMKSVSHSIHMEWVGANPNSKIISEDAVSYYFTYPNVKASAYKKIILKNIYPNIDVEYVFPDASTSLSMTSGIKYSLILHPGADASVIKMKYSDAVNLKMDKDGNIQISTLFGNIVDHAPLTFYSNQNNLSIGSAFELKNDIVTFKLSNFDNSQTVIIDPWTTNPNFPTFNAAYDVAYDYAGNVYAYGGANPLREVKFNSAGAIQWVYNATPLFLYGGFAVDANSGSSYIGEGYNFNLNSNTPAQMVKVNAAGTQVVLYPGNINMKEIWRIAFNNCTKQGVIGGSGWNTSYEAAVLDTTLTSINSINILSPNWLKDVDLLALDNSGNCFMGFSTSGSTSDNQLIKCPASTLSPVYNVQSNFQMTEIQSTNYVNNTTGTNGMNGIAVNNKYLYTWNSSKIKKYNKNTGAPIDSAVITSPVYCCFPNFYLSITWGGLAVDECNNIFIGSHDTIYQLDSAYHKVTFIQANGDVYDLKLGPGNLLYACGKTFVSSFPSGVTCGSLNVSLTASGSCAASSASVTVTGGSAPYTYVWNPSGQTTQVVTGLPSGTYTVTVSDNSCPPLIQTATVTITSGALTASVTSTPAACLANNGTATASPTGGTSPFTYSWSPSGGTNASSTGLSAGTYTVTVTDASGCSGTSTVTVTSIITFSISASSTPANCSAGNGTSSATVSGGTYPYTYSWSPSGGTSATATGLAGGTYTITITDGAGCTQTQTVTVTSSGTFTLSVSSTPASCTASNGTATANTTGGTSPFTYNWTIGQTTQTVTGLGAGTYTATVTDASGCTQTQIFAVTQPSSIAVTASSTPTPCGINNGTATAVGSGGTLPYTYNWSPTGQTTPTITGLAAGNYSATVTDANGCSSTTTVSVTSAGGPTAGVSANITITSGSSTTLTATGGGNYTWSNGASTSPITVTPSITTIYCVTVLDANNCSDTACVTVFVETITDCSPAATGELYLPNAFSPNDDGENDVLKLYYGAMQCIKTFDLHIYNRWGETVFQTTDPTAQWDGTFKGKKEDTAVFDYYMKVTLISGDEIIRKGNISLMR